MAVIDIPIDKAVSVMNTGGREAIALAPGNTGRIHTQATPFVGESLAAARLLLLKAGGFVVLPEQAYQDGRADLPRHAYYWADDNGNPCKQEDATTRKVVVHPNDRVAAEVSA